MKKNWFLHLLVLLAALGMLQAAGLCSLAASGRWETTTSRDAEDNIVVTFPDVEVLLPADWSGKVQMNYTDNGPCFYHIDSRDKWTEELGFESGGFLFGITFAEDGNYDNYENGFVIGSTSEGSYLAYFPSDVQAFTEDASVAADYEALEESMDWIKEHIVLTAEETAETETEPAQDSEYILPNSSTEYLTVSDLAGMNANKLQMAINEIYARHGRRFKLENVQEYFDSKSWYQGTIDPDAFDPGVFNAYEKANIDLMVAQMDAVS